MLTVLNRLTSEDPWYPATTWPVTRCLEPRVASEAQRALRAAGPLSLTSCGRRTPAWSQDDTGLITGG